MQYSIVNYSHVSKELFRIEAEYYKPVFLEIENKFKKNPSLEEFAEKVVCGPFGSTVLDETYTNSGVKVIRPFNIKNYQIEKENIVYVSHNDIEDKQLKTFTKGVIFFSRVGDIKCGIFTEDEAVTISPNIIAVDVKKEFYSPYFLTLFFNSKYGFLQIERELKISAQPTVVTERLQKLKLPLVDISFQAHISFVFEKAKDFSLLTEEKYNEAQTLLLSELDLTDYQPKHRLAFVKNYSDTKKAGRTDAEYFQPKYEEIINAVQGYSSGCDTLGNLVHLNDKNFQPKDKERYKYIELANIADNGEISDCMIEEGQDLPSRARRKVSTGDVIVSSIEGSSSSIALIQKEYNQALCSTGFHIIRTKAFSSEVLLVLLKSIVGQLQLKKGCSGTILTAINKNEFSNLTLPKITEESQTRIQKKVIQSFSLRKRSKHLLECAKHAVEMAIEQDEQAAINWLKEQVQVDK